MSHTRAVLQLTAVMNATTKDLSESHVQAMIQTIMMTKLQGITETFFEIIEILLICLRARTR